MKIAALLCEKRVKVYLIYRNGMESYTEQETRSIWLNKTREISIKHSLVCFV